MERHLDPETAYRFVEESLSDEESARVREHLEHCGECRSEVQMAESFASTSVEPLNEDVEGRLRQALPTAEAPRVEPRRAHSAAPRRLSGWWMRGLAAAGIAVVAVGVWQLRTQEPEQGTLRGVDATDWRLTVDADANGWEVSWAAQRHVEAYRVLVQSEEGQTVWETESATSSLRIERAVLAEFLDDGTAYFVFVRAHDAGQDDMSPPVSLPQLE